MKHVKTFNRLFENNEDPLINHIEGNDPLIKDLEGKKIKRIVGKNSIEFHLTNGDIIYFGCEGGNSVSLDSDNIDIVNDFEQYQGWIITTVTRTSDYGIEIDFNNDKSMTLSDDTGGEGLSIYR